MNRRIVSIVILVLSLSLFGLLLYSTSFNDRLDKFYVSEDEWAKITESRDEDITLDISPLKINYEKPFVSDGNVLYYSMIDGDANRLNPTIQIGSGLKLAIKGEKLSDESIAQNTKQQLLVYNNKFYKVFDLVTTNLPLLSIDYESDLPTSREDVGFNMSLYDNRIGILNRITNSDGKLHKRGRSSFYSKKGSYSVDLTQKSFGNNVRSNPKSLLGMRESDKWMLHNIAFDFEKVRDFFATKLWMSGSADRHSFDFSNSSEWEFVELIENGTYSGLYLLGHKPDKGMINYDANAEHPDIVFKAAEEDNFYDFIVGKINYLEYYSLETDDVDRDMAYSVLRDYIKSLYSSDSAMIDKNSDFKNAIDFNIFINATQNIDAPRYSQGMLKNAYITFKWDGDHYRAVLTPWDFDIALGSDSLAGLQYNSSAEENVLLTTDYIAAKRRIGDTEICRSLATRYRELRQGVWDDDHLNKIIDTAESKIYNSGAFLRDLDRWPNTNHGDASLKLSRFRDYILSRFSYLDTYYLPWNTSAMEAEGLYVFPNYISVYLSTGVLLSPDDPEYLEAKPEVIEDESAVTGDEDFYYVYE